MHITIPTSALSKAISTAIEGKIKGIAKHIADSLKKGASDKSKDIKSKKNISGSLKWSFKKAPEDTSVKQLKNFIDKHGLKNTLPEKGSGKKGNLVKKDYVAFVNNVTGYNETSKKKVLKKARFKRKKKVVEKEISPEKIKEEDISQSVTLSETDEIPPEEDEKSIILQKKIPEIDEEKSEETSASAEDVTESDDEGTESHEEEIETTLDTRADLIDKTEKSLDDTIVTENEFKKYVRAQYSKKVDITKPDDIENKTGLDKEVIATIQTRYKDLTKKFPKVVSRVEKKIKKTEPKKTKRKPLRGRTLLKKN